MKKRCDHCSKKIRVVEYFECRCLKFYCRDHRYASTHNCTFDYFKSNQEILKKDNPVVSVSKISFI